MPGRFKLDENLPRDAQMLLSAAGHDAETVLEEQLGGHPDTEVYSASLSENRIVVTLDVDFADIHRYPPSSHPGIWVLRPQAQSIETILTLLRGALAVFQTESAKHQLWIVEHGRIRIRE